MKLEAVNGPILYRWPGGEILLKPGQPLEVPDERAKKILAKASGQVRIAGQPDWRAGWRQLAAATSGLERDDPRLKAVMAELAECDACFVRDDWPGFVTAAAQVLAEMASKTP